MPKVENLTCPLPPGSSALILNEIINNILPVYDTQSWLAEVGISLCLIEGLAVEEGKQWGGIMACWLEAVAQLQMDSHLDLLQHLLHPPRCFRDDSMVLLTSIAPGRPTGKALETSCQNSGWAMRTFIFLPVKVIEPNLSNGMQFYHHSMEL